MTYDIQPITISVGSKTHTAKYISFSVNYSVGMTEMPVYYTLTNDESSLYNDVVYINQTELDNWGTNNDYIIDLVATKAGVVLV